MITIERIDRPTRIEAPHKGVISGYPLGATVVSSGVDLFIAEDKQLLGEVAWNLDAFMHSSNSGPRRIFGDRWLSYKIMRGTQESGQHLVATFPSDDCNPDKNNPLSTRFNLTEQQRELLSLFAQGLNNNEIAGILTISPSTASTHIRIIRRRLGQKTSEAAVVVAAKLNLLDIKPEELREIPIEGFDRLSDTERHILDMMIGEDGSQPVITNRAIALKRGVKPHTVGGQFTRMFSKINPRNRIQLVWWYFFYQTQRDRILQLRESQQSMVEEGST